MAQANNNRDVRMTLSVETLGAEDIKKLQDSVQNLAKEGGEAAPEFQRLADEIGRLGEQSKALQSFTELAEETAELTARQQQASTSAADLAARLAALSAKTQEASERQRAAAAALEAAQKAARDTRDELATLTATTDRAGKAEAEYANEVTRLKLAKIAQRAEIEKLSAELAKSTAEVRGAEKAEAQLSASYNKAEAAAAKAAQAVEANANALRQAADEAQDLGVVTDNIAAAQAELVLELNRAGQSARTLQEQVERLAAAERELEAIRAFEAQAEAAQRLQVAGDYARLFEEAIRNLAETQRQLEQQQADERWQREAEAMVDAAHAAQELARQTAILEAAQRELAAQHAFERQAEEARRLIEAADYVRNWEEQLAAAERQARETAEASEAAARQISDAFDTLGIRSAQDLEAEIARVREAMRTVENQAGLTGGQLESAFDAGNERIADLEQQLRAANGELTLGDQLAELFSNSIGQIAAGNLVADAIGSLVEMVKNLAVEFVKTIVETQNLRRALMAVYNDSKLAATQFEFLKKTANSAGVAIGDIVQAFVKFSAATKASGISMETTNALFKEVTRTAGLLGLSGEQVTGMLEALGQMASKGTVSMEELRQQLGDRLPGALSLVAQGLGLTEAELVKLVESGGLAAGDLFPALTSALSTMKGEATGLSNRFQLLKNVLTETAQTAGDGLWTAVLEAGLSALGVVVGGLAIAFSFLSETIGIVAKSAGILAASIVSLTDPTDELNRVLKESQQRHDKLTASILNNLSGTQSAAAAATEHAKAMKAVGEEAAESALAISTTELALKAQAFASDLAAKGTFDLNSQMVQVTANIETLVKAQERQIESDAKLAKAAKIQGDALVTLTELRGKDFLSMEAQAEASEKYAAAMDKTAKSQLTHTELLVLERQEVVRISAALGEDIRVRKVQLEAIDKKIVASKAETEQAQQSAAAAEQEARARRLAIQTYQDNSKAVEEFRKAVVAAEEALKATIIAERDGYGTKEQIAAATQRAAEATHLYNDAIQDSIDALELQNRVQQATINLAQTKLEIEQRNYQSLAQAARASGDYVMALYYEIEARRRQIEIIKLVSEAKRLEAEATIKALEIERAALDQQDPMLKAKQAEIDIRLANAKAKLLEASAGKLAIEALEREIQALRDNDLVRQNGRQGIDKDTESRTRNAKSIDMQTEAIDRQKGAMYNDQNMALDMNGNVINATTEPAPWRGSSGDWNYVDSKGNWRKSKTQPVKDPKGGWMDAAGTAGVNNYGVNNGIPMMGAGGAPADGKAGANGSPTTGAAKNATQTININLGGKTTPVTVASEADAKALNAVLRQLETAAGASA